MLKPSSVTQDDIHGKPNTIVNGIDGWAEKAIAGRGILIDYPLWAEEQGIPYDSMSTHPITVEDMKAIMTARNIEPRQGDILLLRTGYVPAYLSLDAVTKESLQSAAHTWPGLKQEESMIRWLWEQQFSAIAADNPALECIREFPFQFFYPYGYLRGSTDQSIAPLNEEWMLHPILLAGWGTPIGELFDLEALAVMCKRRRRWSFFVTSVPLNYRGVVASPPNAMAIF